MAWLVCEDLTLPPTNGALDSLNPNLHLIRFPNDSCTAQKPCSNPPETGFRTWRLPGPRAWESFVLFLQLFLVSEIIF